MQSEHMLSTLTELDDEALLALICSHDEMALSSLYERYNRLLYSIALRITQDRHAAEEVMQDVFHSVWLRARTFRPSAGSVPTWLSSIARNRAIDEMRSRWQRAREYELSCEYLPDLNGAIERGLEHFAVLRADLRQAMATLPTLQRQVLMLAYFNGLSSSEIAAQLGEPLGTIKGRMRLGMEKMRQALHDLVDQDETSDT